jgi:hypothetical protein
LIASMDNLSAADKPEEVKEREEESEEEEKSPEDSSGGVKKQISEAIEYNKEIRAQPEDEWICCACNTENEGFRKLCRSCAVLRKDREIKVRDTQRPPEGGGSSAGEPPRARHRDRRKELLPRVGPALAERPNQEPPSPEETEEEFTHKDDFLSLCSEQAIAEGTWYKKFHPRAMVTAQMLDFLYEDAQERGKPRTSQTYVGPGHKQRHGHDLLPDMVELGESQPRAVRR